MRIKSAVLYLSKIWYLATGLLISLTGVASAQTEIIPVLTRQNAVVLQVTPAKQVTMIYLGKKLAREQDYSLVQAQYKKGSDISGIFNSAYTPSGSRNLVEPAISVTHADGNPSLNLEYVSHYTKQIDNGISLTGIILKDPVYAFEVTLFYKAYYNEDVLEQWAVIKHREKGKVILQKYASANLYLQGSNFWLKQYHGNWAREMQPEEAQLTHGIKVIDTKLGTRANLYEPSAFMVSVGKPATEDEGQVLYGAVEWSGNFKIDLELDALDNLRVIAGINNYASAYELKAAEEFATPALLYTFSATGKGNASRQLQRWARKYRILDGQGSRLTLLNNWEATKFNFDETKLKELIHDTKKLGVDLFLLDDGWFGNQYPRNNDKTGLGDWQENKQKLPNGIGTIIQQATREGVKFGIWVEPEMVNPKSQLYSRHPDWVVKQPQRPEQYQRNQLVLDLSNPKVQDFVFSIVDTLFSKYPQLAYIKWDCNAVIFNAYSNYQKQQSNFYVGYVRGLYRVWERIRAKYPKVPMMLCSGGGARVDYAALKYFTEFWPSDNTDPLERIFLQWEYSYFYPAIASANHVTDWGKQPLKYRVDVAMMGKLGFDIAVNKLSATDLKFCQDALLAYKTVQHTIWHGDQYRLVDPWENNIASVMYMDSTRSNGVVFNYLVRNRYGSASQLPVRFKGLDATKSYRIQEINLYPGAKPALKDQILSGDFLMEVGFNPIVTVARTSVVLKITDTAVK